ncbi:hypothetical protein HPB48_009383 [Haemaphysalis longicornis]|uniref:Uncharacterized protein n=1 Tax=Haemaphysalis longicornis TaxID=44386 RepID=A0A9J6FDF4_HAELO|nr:hypothetical protein HPB48_009383 [Haemaphysalis longicornis]
MQVGENAYSSRKTWQPLPCVLRDHAKRRVLCQQRLLLPHRTVQRNRLQLLWAPANHPGCNSSY